MILLIRYNNITDLESDAFSSYPKLYYLNLMSNNILHIREGAFSGLNSLEELYLIDNEISQFPSSFGTPTQSLEMMNLWDTLSVNVKTSMFYPLLSEFINLKSLNLGHNYLRHFNASVLPENLKEINLGYNRLIEFPDFASYAPNLETIGFYENPLVDLPGVFIRDMVHLKELDITDNMLLTIPDLYHMNLTSLEIAGNPLKCNQSLCWIRMWPWMKIPVLGDTPVCESHSFVHGTPLMDIPPTDIKCYNGKCL